MLLGLSKIIDSPGASIPFSTSVDLRDLRYGNSFPVTDFLVPHTEKSFLILAKLGLLL